MHNILIHILRNHIHEAQTAPFDCDWGELLTLAKQHEVTGIVYSQCKEFVPEPYISDLNKHSSSELFYYVNRQMIVRKIEAAMADLDYFTIKGDSIAQYYPVPAYRTMGDTDLVIHKEDRAEVDHRLKAIGLKCIHDYYSGDWLYSYQDMSFEIHDHLVYSESVNVDIQEKFFNDYWKHVSGNKLDWNFHFMFLIFHMRKHFMNSGIGFRYFLDIAVLTLHGPEFDWKWIRNELETIGLWSFTERVFVLNEYWFDVPSPISISAMSSSFLMSATELIAKNGIFGFDNEENRNNAAVNATRWEGNTKGSMLKHALTGLMPGYKDLRTVPRYYYINGRPYLLPIAWIHRAVRTILNGRTRRNVKTLIDGTFTDRETIEKREAIYQEWGL